MWVFGALTGGDVAQIMATVGALVAAYFVYRRGMRQDKMKAEVDTAVQDDHHQIELIRVSMDSQAAALTTYQSQLVSCNERTATLEGRVEELSREKDELRRNFDEETKAMRHEIGTLRVEVRASKVIIERQDEIIERQAQELALWHNYIPKGPTPDV